ncbi:MAG TPA: PH domain-containing protein [Steroidobacteraceae bacterium]
MPRTTYPSKVDAILMIPLLCLALGCDLLSGALPTQAHVVAFAARLLMLLVLLLVVWTALGTWYAFDGRVLCIRSGPFRWKIELDDIHAVTPSRDLRSGPALSRDRLRIDYGAGRTILISPRDQAGFLRELQRRQLTQ